MSAAVGDSGLLVQHVPKDDHMLAGGEGPAGLSSPSFRHVMTERDIARRDVVPAEPPTHYGLPGVVYPSGVGGRAGQARRRESGRLKRGVSLGGGGQGRVHELAGDPSRVVKDFITPISGMEEVFEGLVLAGANVQRHLAGEPITLAWPEETVISGRDITGYVMPSIPDKFFWQDKKHFRSSRRLRDLQYAVPRESAVSIPFRADDSHRLELVRLVATFLEAMHREELVYGDLSWVNFAFSVDGRVELCVFDFDSTRRIGRPTFTRQHPAQSIDWNDLEDRSGAVATLDSDRYKFALLVHRLLVAHDWDSRPDIGMRVDSISGLDHRAVQHLQSLLRRAAGRAGTRPQISEWLAVLQG